MLGFLSLLITATFLPQCPRPRQDVYCGEILLGIKFAPGPEPSNANHCSSNGVVKGVDRDGGVVSECQEARREGLLQVHVVEGARLVDEDTNKPFKSVVKW